MYFLSYYCVMTVPDVCICSSPWLGSICMRWSTAKVQGCRAPAAPALQTLERYPSAEGSRLGAAFSGAQGESGAQPRAPVAVLLSTGPAAPALLTPRCAAAFCPLSCACLCACASCQHGCLHQACMHESKTMHDLICMCRRRPAELRPPRGSQWPPHPGRADLVAALVWGALGPFMSQLYACICYMWPEDIR
jgi:hypothetical protein